MLTLAQAKASVASTQYDLILLDLMLPDGKGIDFLKRLRASGDSTPVIILTALDQLSDRIAGLNAGADDYLIKPFDLAELSARIRSEEHTSELQSRPHLVCRLLLEKKNNKKGK